MIVKTISVTYGRKINIGDYNSMNVEVTYWADVEPGEDLHEAQKALWDMATANVQAKANAVLKPKETEAKQIFLGLPVEVRKEMNECPSSD